MSDLKKLKEYRKKAGYTQMELCELLQLSKPTYIRLEKEGVLPRYRFQRIFVIKKLNELLDINLEVIR